MAHLRELDEPIKPLTTIASDGKSEVEQLAFCGKGRRLKRWLTRTRAIESHLRHLVKMHIVRVLSPVAQDACRQ